MLSGRDPERNRRGEVRFRSLEETSDFWSLRHLVVSIRPPPNPAPIEVFRSQVLTCVECGVKSLFLNSLAQIFWGGYKDQTSDCRRSGYKVCVTGLRQEDESVRE